MSESLGEQARRIAAATRQKVGAAFFFLVSFSRLTAFGKLDPVDLFREDMLRAAHKGFFACSVELNAAHGPVGFFLG